MRKLTSAIALTLATALFVAGCTAVDTKDNRPLIVVTTNILGDAVSNVVGDEAEVLVLMKPDADPHSFEISAQEASRILSADLIVSNGLGLEEGLASHLETAAAERVPMLVAGDVITTLPYTSGDSEGTIDPHWWTDPGRMIEVVDAVAEAVTSTLTRSSGVNTDTIATNAREYTAQLEELDAEMADSFDALGPHRRALVTNHHVFGYLADRFDFAVLGAAIPSGTTLAAPSASDLRELVTAINDAGVRTIFAESSQPDRLVQVLADEADLDVEVTALYTESLTGPQGGAPDYLTMMRVNTERIATGLSP